MKDYCQKNHVNIVTDAQSDRVLLRDVTSITLHRGSQTAGRRSSPVPQLKCVGGTAYGQYSPKAVQCVNRGFDGMDVQWECKADMPNDFEFGKIDVSCEGYAYAKDPYILAASCGLNYELDYTSSGAKKSSHYKKPSAPYEHDTGIKFDYILYFLIACFVVYLIYTSLCSPREGSEGDRRGDGGGSDHGPPPPPGWRQPPPPPPSYDESCKHGTGSQANAGNTSANTNTNSGPGFFTGMGLGALGGYLFGGRNTGYDGNGNTFRRRNRGYNQFEQDTGFDGPSTSTGYFGWRNDGGGSSSLFGNRSGSGSSGTHTSTSFGGTSRR